MRLTRSLRHRLDNLSGRVERWRERPTVRRFTRLYFSRREATWADTRFLGVPVAKLPLDLWVYQEIVFETRPDLIVETGTAHGGSALYLASVCELLGRGRVVSVDIAPGPSLPRHERVTFIRGSSVDPAVVAEVRGHARAGERVMVVLDSDHSEAHVLKELEAYAPLVTPGCYLVVEDTALDALPLLRRFGPGPAAAVRRFLKSNDLFETDRAREKFMASFNPGGYLLRR